MWRDRPWNSDKLAILVGTSRARGTAVHWAYRLGALAVIAACGAPRLPAPSYVGQPTSALVPIPYPPPPARVEMIPDEPKGDVVWIDGEWRWQAGRWAWLTGRWVTPPANAKYSPWTTVRDASGALYYASSVWRDSSGKEVAEPPAVLIGKARPTSVVSPEGDELSPGPTLRSDGGANDSEADRDRRAAEAMDRLDSGAPDTLDGGT